MRYTIMNNPLEFARMSFLGYIQRRFGLSKS